MNSVFQEIEKLRGNHSLNLNETLSNRYTVHCQESPGIKTAYCFSVPIRNIKTNDVVDLKFYHSKQGSIFIGSNVKIIIAEKIRMINQYGQCDITFQGQAIKKTNESVFFSSNTGLVEIRPTLNGIILIFDCNFSSSTPQILLHFDRSFESIRANNKFFSLMREKFTPFITASCIGSMNVCGKVIDTCEISSEKLNDFEYVLSFCSVNKSKKRIAIEINMHESKLFQDTTVESKNPTINNVFGGISFLGTSKVYGEQWLYSRLEISNISHLQNKKIIKSTLHIPQLGYHTPQISINRISKRFCSFESNWENKITLLDSISLSSESNGYYHLDLTQFLGHFEKKSKNFVIRECSSTKPIIIPTGDSFYAPQILEVRYQ